MKLKVKNIEFQQRMYPVELITLLPEDETIHGSIEICGTTTALIDVLRLRVGDEVDIPQFTGVPEQQPGIPPAGPAHQPSTPPAGPAHHPSEPVGPEPHGKGKH